MYDWSLNPLIAAQLLNDRKGLLLYYSHNAGCAISMHVHGKLHLALRVFVLLPPEVCISDRFTDIAHLPERRSNKMQHRQ
jgi:hypothetical protein